MTPREAYDGARVGLRAALRPAGLRVLDGPADRVDRDSVILGPPSFLFEGQCEPDQPSGMTLVVYLVTQFDERAIERLLDALPTVLGALPGIYDATVTDVQPGTFPTSGAELPCYRLTAEMTL